jgi:hypothetical protein
MNENKKLFLGKKRNTEDIINSNNENNNNLINKKDEKKEDKETITLFSHSHWINKILILKNQIKHNLISSSADGLIILYDEYPKFNQLLKMKLFGESGVINLTELKDGTIIACSFAAIKQIMLNYDKNTNNYSYEIVNYFVICSTYVSKCLELINEDLLCITQQNSIIFLRKINENIISLKKSNNYDKKDLIELLPNELCINILQLTNQLFISCNITNSKYDLSINSDIKKSINCIKFYDHDFNFIRKIPKIYPTKSQNSLVKINDKLVIVGAEVCTNEINWNNNKGIALINYQYLELISFYETDNPISSITFYVDLLYLGDDKGFVRKYKLEEQEIIKQNIKRVHQYNISTIEYNFVFDMDSKQNIFIILTGSNDQTIKISHNL